MSFSALATRVNSANLAVFAESVTYRDSAGVETTLQALYYHSDELVGVERFEARESDFPSIPKQGDTIIRASGSMYRLAPPERVDGDWLILKTRNTK